MSYLSEKHKLLIGGGLIGLAALFTVISSSSKRTPRLAPILTLVSANDVARVREAIVRQHSQLREVDFDGNTPLHIAAMMGSAEMVDALLEAGADRELKNTDGETPLDAARRTGRKKVVRALEGPLEARVAGNG